MLHESRKLVTYPSLCCVIARKGLRQFWEVYLQAVGCAQPRWKAFHTVRTIPATQNRGLESVLWSPTSHPLAVARMRLRAPTCHHFLVTNIGIVVCAGRSDPPEEWAHHLGGARPRKRSPSRIRHWRQFLCYSQIVGRAD